GPLRGVAAFRGGSRPVSPDDARVRLACARRSRAAGARAGHQPGDGSGRVRRGATGDPGAARDSLTVKPAPTVLDILAARQRLSRYLRPTPLLRSAWLSEATGASVFLKIESLQPARSFKIRGAMNALLRLAGSGAGASPPIVTA